MNVNEGEAYWADKLTTHDPKHCVGRACTIHNMSAHHMRNWPQLWRADRGIMERVCVHGVGHPDPDDYRCSQSEVERLHGCDGCCAPPRGML